MKSVLLCLALSFPLGLRGEESVLTVCEKILQGFSYTAEAEVSFPEDGLVHALRPGEDRKKLVSRYSVEYASVGEKYSGSSKVWNGKGEQYGGLKSGFDGTNYYTSYQPGHLLTSVVKETAQRGFSWMWGSAELLTLPFAAYGTPMNGWDAGHRSAATLLSAHRGPNSDDATQVEKNWSVQLNAGDLFPEKSVFESPEGKRITWSVTDWDDQNLGDLRYRVPKVIRVVWEIGGVAIKQITYKITSFSIGPVKIAEAPFKDAGTITDLDSEQ